MGTTRIKVIDLSSDKKEIKTSRKHAEKLTGAAKLKATGPEGALARREGPKAAKVTKVPEETKPATTESSQTSSVLSEPSAPPVIKEQSAPSAVARHRHHHLGKKYNMALALIDRTKLYPPQEALDLLAKTSFVKFDPTVELHLNVADKNIKGKVNLPHPIAKKKEKKVLVFSDQRLAISDQRIIWGDEKTIEEIAAGKLKPSRNFDIVFSTPKFMPQLAKVAKILGPVGLMPNPKNGTVVENVSGAVKNISDESLEYKTDPNAPIIHTSLGKLSKKTKQLEENLKTIIFAVGSTKIKEATLTSTMGPGIRLDLSTITK